LTTDRAEQLQIESRLQWRRWLAKHHPRTDGLWLVTWKKTSGGPHVSYDDVVEEAVAHGWIDSKPRARRIDDTARLAQRNERANQWARKT
jgi:uncharacterized protein YdeI (YjbR/CyaY-like superfamily)